MRITLLDAPAGWSVPELPDGVTLAGEPGDGSTRPAELIVAFCGELATVRGRIAALAARIFPDGPVWIAWPRRAGGHDSDIREGDIRDLALPLGLVDVKVAALEKDWSGLRLMWRRERRQTSGATPG
jgi:hypothetical protein